MFKHLKEIFSNVNQQTSKENGLQLSLEKVKAEPQTTSMLSQILFSIFYPLFSVGCSLELDTSRKPSKCPRLLLDTGVCHTGPLMPRPGRTLEPGEVKLRAMALLQISNSHGPLSLQKVLLRWLLEQSWLAAQLGSPTALSGESR